MEKQSEVLHIGDRAPDFTLTDPATGDDCCLRQWAGSDVLLVFLRGTWCPFCRAQMRVLTQNHARIAAAGVQVVAVICQSAGSVRRHLVTHPLPFPLLADETRRVAKAYGVHYWLSWEGINLARPALFVLDQDHRVTFQYVGANQTDLPVTTVLERFVILLGQSPGN